MRGVLLGLVVLSLIASAWALNGKPIEENEKQIPAEEMTKPSIERDLVLQVKWLSPKAIQPGRSIQLDMALVNQSEKRVYPVIKPGDGSESGWREPNVFFTAKRKTQTGTWVEVPKAPFGRCGLFDSNWEKDVTKLTPGAKIELKDWLLTPGEMLEFQQPGPHRLWVHYKYSGGNAGKRTLKEPLPVAKMQGVPAFEIVSSPIEFEVVRPLDLVLKPKAPLKIKSKTTLSEILDVQLVNRSNKPIEVASATLSADARLQLEIEGQFGGWAPNLNKQNTTYGIKKSLEPGNAVSLLGAGDLANGLDGDWEYPVEDTVKIRAIYHASTWKPAAIIKSEWVEVKVEK